MLFETEFIFQKKAIVPILIVTGKGDNIPLMDRALLHVALSIIEKVDKFHGRILEPSNNDQFPKVLDGKIAIRFSVIFKNTADCEKACESLIKEFG